MDTDYQAARLRIAKEFASIALRRMNYSGTGFADRTIEALCIGGIERPEMLFRLKEADIRSIAGIGKVAFAEICAYRDRFAPAAP